MDFLQDRSVDIRIEAFSSANALLGTPLAELFSVNNPFRFPESSSTIRAKQIRANISCCALALPSGQKKIDASVAVRDRIGNPVQAWEHRRPQDPYGL